MFTLNIKETRALINSIRDGYFGAKSRNPSQLKLLSSGTFFSALI